MRPVGGMHRIVQGFLARIVSDVAVKSVMRPAVVGDF